MMAYFTDAYMPHQATQKRGCMDIYVPAQFLILITLTVLDNYNPEVA